MSTPPRDKNKSDAAILAEAYAGTKRLEVKHVRHWAPAQVDRFRPAPTAPGMRPSQHTQGIDLTNVRFDVSTDEEGVVSAYRSGTDPSLVTKIRRGELMPSASVDLHGMVAQTAEATLSRFVLSNQGERARVVRIVHGKGLHSAEGISVLRDLVYRLLSHSSLAQHILAFASAPRNQGGIGATLVVIARRR